MPEQGESLFETNTPRLYTVPPSRPFLDDLALRLYRQEATSPLELSDIMIFLPTRRAARGLEEAFLRVAGNAPGATLLPRIRTLGDVSDEDTLSADLDLTQLPPALSSLERRLTLARLVHQFYAQTKSTDASWTQSINAADELSKLLDSFHAEEVGFDQLENLVPEQYASHWQGSLTFLKILTENWPTFLTEQNRSDPALRRRDQIDRLCQKWIKTPPNHPVIIAGSTGSMPAVARLMSCVAAMPQGAVILPGLDTSLDETAWSQIDDPHPQAGFKALLERHFDTINRQSVPDIIDAKSETGRRAIISLALRPAEATSDWLAQLEALESKIDLYTALQNLHLVEMPDEDREARAIAVLMREALEHPEKTAMLVTPDRNLARRVSLLLQRWDIQIDESAGVPFLNTLRGTFLRLVAKWLDDVSDPVALLAMLKHPLFQGDEKIDRHLIGPLDLMLRGLRPGPGFAGLKKRLEHGRDWDKLTREETADTEDEQKPTHLPALLTLVDHLEILCTPFFDAVADPASKLAAHLTIAETLCEEGRLWMYEDGRQGATLMHQLKEAFSEQASTLFLKDDADYSAVFEALCQGVSVRQTGGTHPRLSILGPLEARLLKADRIILGGLNEGSWPDEADTDPFLSRQMRKTLGLPSPEQRIGLAARDFAELSSGNEVFLTRAKRMSRAPQKPSRWIIRLKNILDARDLLDQVDETPRLLAYNDAMNQAPDPSLINKPAPTPPQAARPLSYSVTDIETLMRDPYSIYARKILGLRDLDPLKADTTLALRGQLFHHVFAQYALDYPDAPPDNSEEVLKTKAAALFEKAGLPPSIQAFWQGRMEESFAWFANWDKEQRKLCRPAIIEEKGEANFPLPDGTMIKLRARTDRIDLATKGADAEHIAIYDYKTTAPPSLSQAATFSPQLQLTAMIAAQGGFETLGARQTFDAAFIRVLGDGMKTPIKRLEKAKLQETIQLAEKRLIDLLQHYNNPDTPYHSQPRPQYTKAYGTFDHLARRSEWALQAEGDEG